MIISVPGMRVVGKRTNALVEFVDMDPSFVELAGLSLLETLESTSFKPIRGEPQHPR